MTSFGHYCMLLALQENTQRYNPTDASVQLNEKTRQKLTLWICLYGKYYFLTLIKEIFDLPGTIFN